MDAATYEDDMAAVETYNGSIYFADRDFRSSIRDRLRERKQKEKYYYYRASRPEMVGKCVYSLTTTKPKLKAEVSPTSKRRWVQKRGNDDLSTEEEEYSNPFKNSSSRYPCDWSVMNSPELITAAASQVDRDRHSSRVSSYKDNTLLSCELLDKQMKQYREWIAMFKDYYSGGDAISHLHVNTRLRLKVQKWTKRDNYINRVEFHRHYYIEKRHHSRKLSYDGKRYQKMTLREIRRDTKSKSALLEVYKCSAGRWDRFADEGGYCPCCHGRNIEPGIDPHGVEEYLWKWDEECLCDWSEGCTCEWAGYQWNSSTSTFRNDSETTSDWASCEDGGVEADVVSPTIVVNRTDYFVHPASPTMSVSSWILYAASAMGSEFDMVSDLGVTFSDDEWEEIAVNPAL